MITFRKRSFPSGSSPEAPATSLASLWLAGASALVALVVTTEWVRLPVPDVSWLLYVTKRVAHGAEYGVEIADVAPPTIIWYSRPAIWLADWLGLSLWHGFIVVVVATALASLFLVWYICRRSPSWGPRGARQLLAVSAAALLVLPWGAFGEREHVAVILVLPYVLLFAVREDDILVPRWLGVWVGAFAGFGFAIKPHFAIPWVLLGATALWRRRGVALERRIEFLAASMVAALCVLTVLWHEVGYTGYMRRFAGLYLHYVPQDPVFVTFFGESKDAPVVLLAALATGVLWRGVGPNWRPSVLYLLVAGIGFHAAASIQLKGWRYHYLPGLALSLVLLIVLLSSLELPRRLVARVYRAAALVMVTVVLGSAVLGSVTRLARFDSPTFDADFEGLLASIKRAGRGRPVAVLSANLGSAFPLTAEAGIEWALRYGGLPWLPALYEDQVQSGQVVQPRSYAARSDVERSFGEAVVADLRRSVPGLIIVPRPQPSSSYYVLFDYLAYFGEVPGFRSVLDNYRPVDRVGVYTVLLHRALPAPTVTGDWKRPLAGARTPAFLSEWGQKLVLVALSVVVVLAAEVRDRHRLLLGAG